MKKHSAPGHRPDHPIPDTADKATGVAWPASRLPGPELIRGRMLKLFSTAGRDSATAFSEAVRAADVARDARDWPEAAELYRKALEVDCEAAPIWVQFGHALKESGDLFEAEAAYRQALALDGGEADTYLQLGHLHKIMGRKREAAQNYARALERDPGLDDARIELSRMGWSAARLRALQAKASRAAPQTQGVRIALELSDLVDFLQSARYPTGIQRVQLALGQALAGSFGEDQAEFVYFDHLACIWRRIERRQLWNVVDLVENSDRADEERLSIAARIKSELLEGEEFLFEPGCVLVNPGTSWGYLNYFLAIREAKRRSSIKYVPLVHDCIPLLFPEYCNPVLVHDFINWICGILTHADLVLTNSENTTADFHKAADALGLAPKECATVHLNGIFGAGHADGAEEDQGALDILRAHNLDREDFVLFVSTIEPRKNHALALSAWSRMLKAGGAQRVPRLVCVGNTGWMNDEFHQRLSRDTVLRERVVVLNNVSDHVLKLLYRRCLFTLFPSLYEGWGLPISEAIAHGKVPLVSNVSSHREAGGDLAVYFDVDSVADFQTKLERLIHDIDYRESLEQKIAAATPLRPWGAIGKQIYGIAERLKSDAPERKPGELTPFRSPAPLACGIYYSFARNSANRLRDVAYSGDIFRDGLNWHAPEYWGCWIRGRSADLVFSLTGALGDEFVIYLHWTGSSNIDNEAVISLPPSNWSKTVKLSRGQDRWDCIPVSFGPFSKREVRLRITSVHVDDFGKVTEGRDPRLASAGIKGIYVADASSSLQQLSIMQAMVSGDVEPLARRFLQAAML